MRQVSQSQCQAQKTYSVNGSPTKENNIAHYLSYMPVAHSSKRLNGITGGNPQTQYSTQV